MTRPQLWATFAAAFVIFFVINWASMRSEAAKNPEAYEQEAAWPAAVFALILAFGAVLAAKVGGWVGSWVR